MTVISRQKSKHYYYLYAWGIYRITTPIHAISCIPSHAMPSQLPSIPHIHIIIAITHPATNTTTVKTGTPPLAAAP